MRPGDRLLDEQVPAALDDGERCLVVQVMRQDEVHDVDRRIGEDLLQLEPGSRPVLGREGLRARAIDVADRDQVHAVPEPSVRLGVGLGDQAEADDGDPRFAGWHVHTSVDGRDGSSRTAMVAG